MFLIKINGRTTVDLIDADDENNFECLHLIYGIRAGLRIKWSGLAYKGRT